MHDACDLIHELLEPEIGEVRGISEQCTQNIQTQKSIDVDLPVTWVQKNIDHKFRITSCHFS